MTAIGEIERDEGGGGGALRLPRRCAKWLPLRLTGSGGWGGGGCFLSSFMLLLFARVVSDMSYLTGRFSVHVNSTLSNRITQYKQ